MRRKGMMKRVVSMLLAFSLIATSGGMSVLAEELETAEPAVIEMAEDEESDEDYSEPETVYSESEEDYSEPAAEDGDSGEGYDEPEAGSDESEEVYSEPEEDYGEPDIVGEVPEETGEDTVVVLEEESATETNEAEPVEESAQSDTEESTEESPDDSEPMILSTNIVEEEEIPEDQIEEEPVFLDGEEEDDDEDSIIYGTMTMSYAEFYDGLVGVKVDAVSSATTGHSTSFAHADKSAVGDTDFQIYGVTDVPVIVYPDASDDMKARVKAYDNGGTIDVNNDQYWSVDKNGITAHLKTVETVTTAEFELETNSHWADYELEVLETDTSYIRNSRNGDDGFAVNSELMGAVIGTKEGVSYGLWHLRNIWLQPYLIGFNANDENTAGLVGKTITSVTYIMEDGAYVYTFNEGVYVKPAYSGDTVTGKFNDNATTFTLDEIPAGLENPVLSITYSTGSSYNKTTHTLLSASLEKVADGTTFNLEEELPEGVVPTVQILSDNYAQINVSYPMFDFQRTELQALVDEGTAILEANEDPNYSYSLLKEHVQEGTEVLESGDAAEAEDIIDELGELVEEARTIYGTMTMTYEEFYDGKVTATVDAVSSATTGHNTSFAHADKGELTDKDFTLYGVTDVPVKVLPSASSDVKSRVTELEDGESYGEDDQFWTIDTNGIKANLKIVVTVTTAEPVLETNSHWADYELEVVETDTSYIRNTRSDEGFKVNSTLMGAIITTKEGGSYGLYHLVNIWLQPYLIGFNADDENVAGLVGETISSVIYIMEDGSYEFTFADGIYVKPAYDGDTPTGEFNDDATEFTLNEIPDGLENPMLSITYSTGSSYNKTTHTLLSESLENVAEGTTFALTEELPDGVVPTVQILSDNYAQIDVSYPMFDFQREELEALVAEGSAILEASEDPNYSYSMLEEHVAEGKEVLDNGDAAEAADIIDELGELVEASRTIYGTMTMTYEEFYDGKVTASVDAVSSATTGHNTSFAHADKGELTDTDFTLYGVTDVPVKVLPSASSDIKERVVELEDGESYGEDDQFWTIDTNGIKANLKIVVTVTTAEPVLETNSHWADYELEVVETDTSYIRNTRSDEGFAVNSSLMGAIITTEEGDAYGLYHLVNIWLQPYLIGFNADDENVEGLVGQTISSVIYIMQDGSYEFTFEDGIYVKPAYDGDTPTGEFNDDATEFTLNEIPDGLENPMLSISYTESRKTYTLLEVSLEDVAEGTTFALTEELPDGVVPTVQITSDNYMQINVSYPMFDFQREELEGLVEEGLAILEEQAVDGYNYGMLEEHVAEAQDVLANGDAYDAEDIIDELGELIQSYKDALPEPETETESETKTEKTQSEQQSTEPETKAETKETESKSVPAASSETETAATEETEVTTSTSLLLLKGTSKKKSVTLSWNKVKKADGYIIYGAECGSKMQKLATVEGRKNTTYTVKKLTSGTSYKFRVRAYKTVNGKKKVLLKSNTIHVATKGGKFTNVSKVKVSSKSVSLNVGSSQKIKVKTTLVNTKKKLKKHADKITYLSSDTSVAKVTQKGKIKAVGKGTCYVYAIAGDGARKKITVTVE